MTNLLETIRSRGHWEITLRPTVFNQHQVGYEALGDLLQRCQVQMRGWYLPHISHREGIDHGQDWIGQASRFGHHIEVWRFFTSGQFHMVRAFGHDWARNDGSQREILDERTMPVWSILFTLTEVFELAARLVAKQQLEAIRVRAACIDMGNRRLVGGGPQRFDPFSDYTTTAGRLVADETLTQVEALTGARVSAVEATRNMLLKFGWTDASTDVLAGYQAELTKEG